MQIGALRRVFCDSQLHIGTSTNTLIIPRQETNWCPGGSSRKPRSHQHCHKHIEDFKARSESPPSRVLRPDCPARWPATWPSPGLSSGYDLRPPGQPNPRRLLHNHLPFCDHLFAHYCTLTLVISSLVVTTPPPPSTFLVYIYPYFPRLKKLDTFLLTPPSPTARTCHPVAAAALLHT